MRFAVVGCGLIGQKRTAALAGAHEMVAFIDVSLERAEALARAHAGAQAETEIGRALEDPTIWDHLGDVYFRLEETDRAKSAWQKALPLYEADKRRKMDGHQQELKHKLQLLDGQIQSKE